jgi:hypothetical protein
MDRAGGNMKSIRKIRAAAETGVVGLSLGLGAMGIAPATAAAAANQPATVSSSTPAVYRVSSRVAVKSPPQNETFILENAAPFNGNYGGSSVHAYRPRGNVYLQDGAGPAGGWYNELDDIRWTHYSRISARATGTLYSGMAGGEYLLGRASITYSHPLVYRWANGYTITAFSQAYLNDGWRKRPAHYWHWSFTANNWVAGS